MQLSSEGSTRQVAFTTILGLAARQNNRKTVYSVVLSSSDTHTFSVSLPWCPSGLANPYSYFTMPIPVPPGALPQAHRVICMRAVRAIGRRQWLGREAFGFASASSSKCSYCTDKAERCRCVPVYAGPEYDAFWVAFVAWEEAEVEDGLGDTEQAAAEAVLEAAEEELRRAARQLSLVVQVGSVQLRGFSAADMLLHQHLSPPDHGTSAAIRSLQEAVVTLTGEVVALRQALRGQGIPGAAEGSGELRRSARGQTASRRGVKGKGKGRANPASVEDLGLTGGGSDPDSELSSVDEDALMAGLE
jgi:hypothetical protein